MGSGSGSSSSGIDLNNAWSRAFNQGKYSRYGNQRGQGIDLNDATQRMFLMGPYDEKVNKAMGKARDRGDRQARRQIRGIDNYIKALEDRYSTQLAGGLFAEEQAAKDKSKEDQAMKLARILGTFGITGGKLPGQVSEETQGDIETYYGDQKSVRQRGAQEMLKEARRTGEQQKEDVNYALDEYNSNLDTDYEKFMAGEGVKPWQTVATILAGYLSGGAAGGTMGGATGAATGAQIGAGVGAIQATLANQGINADLSFMNPTYGKHVKDSTGNYVPAYTYDPYQGMIKSDALKTIEWDDYYTRMKMGQEP